MASSEAVHLGIQLPVVGLVLRIEMKLGLRKLLRILLCLYNVELLQQMDIFVNNCYCCICYASTTSWGKGVLLTFGGKKTYIVPHRLK